MYCVGSYDSPADPPCKTSFCNPRLNDCNFLRGPPEKDGGVWRNQPGASVGRASRVLQEGWGFQSHPSGRDEPAKEKHFTGK